MGCWQIQRKSWKEDLIQKLQETTRADPIVDPVDLASIPEYRSVTVKGEFIHEKELYLGPRAFIRPDGVESQSGLFSQQDGGSGFLVITPFKLNNTKEVILVNRGWVPKTKMQPEKRLAGQVKGVIELTGVMRKGEPRPQFTPDHRGNIYLYRDLNRMCKETGSEPIFIDATNASTVSKTGDSPIGGQTRITLRNEHLSYIITWFSLSGATAFLWYKRIYKGISTW